MGTQQNNDGKIGRWQESIENWKEARTTPTHWYMSPDATIFTRESSYLGKDIRLRSVGMPWPCRGIEDL